jgi:hypothetical protein
MQPHTNTSQGYGVARFALGQTFITPGAEEALEIAGQTAIEFCDVTCQAIGESCRKTT